MVSAADAVSEDCIIVGFWTVSYYMPQIFGERFQVGPVASGFISAVPWIVSFGVIVVVSRMARNTENLRWYFRPAGASRPRGSIWLPAPTTHGRH
jgi:hypothetical protein